MERKIQKEKGFIFNEETKRLESFEFVKAEFQFAPETPIIYTAMICGEERTFEADDDFKVYRNVEEFKVMAPYAPFLVKSDDVAVRRCSYTFADGKAVDVDVRTERFVYEDGHIKPLRKCYQNMQDVYVYNDIIVCENGEERVVPCLKNRLALDEEQSELCDELKSVLERMKQAGMRLFINDWNGKMSVFNARKVSHLYYGYEARHEVDEDHIDIQSLLLNEGFSVDINVFNDDHDIMVKIED